MTAMRMRQHIAAGIWHFQEAVIEAPSPVDVPITVRAVVANVTRLADFGIDAGHLTEQSRGDTHLMPERDS